MPYLNSLISRIQDSDQWPDFDRPDFLDELNAIADRSYDTNTVEGYLAALLIYHQLTEEMLRLLLECCEFFVQLQLAPIEIHFPLPEKAMFGRLVEATKNAMEFENKTELIALSQQINQDRIALVHGITKQETTETIGRKVKQVRTRFDDFHSKFTDTRDWFYLCFKDMRKDGEWDDLLGYD